MAYISKYDTKFVTFVSKKYHASFDFIDDYRIWLYENYLLYDCELYYHQLEQDLQEYSDFQTGKERDKRGKLNDNWERE